MIGRAFPHSRRSSCRLVGDATNARCHRAGAPEPRLDRLLHPLRRLLERRAAREDSSAFGFGLRLLATVALSFALVGIAGYVLLERSLAHRQITDYAAAQRADANAFEHDGADAASTAGAIAAIDQLLYAVGQRPGNRDAFLIDPRHVIRATVASFRLGTIDAEPHIDAALKFGRSFAGRASGPGRDRNDFEFVIPVNLPGGRYAYEVTYDHRTYDAQLNEVRTILALVGLLALIGGGAVFYLVGGRRLMRDHRMVLRRATRDGLTDLPNQRAFQDEFPQAVASAARYQDPFALALLDVDEFKLINDRHGHPHGDAILKRVAEALREARPGDRPYRTGGDEFALLLAHTDAEGARTVARRLGRALGDSGIEVSIGVSALRPGLQADTLRDEADSALYEAKRQGGNGAAHFDDIRERVVVTTSEKKEAVRRLIDEGRLTTVFQPIWNFEAGTLLGVEALSRPDPSYGLSGPAEAFDIAEQIGRVHRLDVLCVENALRVAPELEPGVLLFLNLSPLTLDLEADANAWLGPAVERAGLSPQAVVVEVTERFGGRTASVVKGLQRLREQGFKIAVDDVGTGNAGLDMLRKIDAEFVKLDRSIVLAAATELSARAVLMAMATFARQTGAFVIAEGIEDDDTLEFLRGLDQRELFSDAIIQGGQGFGLGWPSHELSPEGPAFLRGSQGTPRVLGGWGRDDFSGAASAARRPA
jgi:diguanylate cyclase (GGDEF)-like protein